LTAASWSERNFVSIRGACAALIAVGFLQPLDARILGGSIGVFSILALTVWVAPLVPLVAVFAGRLRKTPVSPVLAKSASIAVLLFGLLLTLIVWAFASPKPGLLVMFHGGALSSGVAASLLLLGGSYLGPFAIRAALSGMTVATGAALWSILAAVMVIGHANRLAGGHHSALRIMVLHHRFSRSGIFGVFLFTQLIQGTNQTPVGTFMVS
jgi:uncharacterized membrane protein YhaH (DUF805 family)